MGLHAVMTMKLTFGILISPTTACRTCSQLSKIFCVSHTAVSLAPNFLELSRAAVFALSPEPQTVGLGN